MATQEELLNADIDLLNNRIKELLTKKGAEYSIPSDRLHNFVHAALLQGITQKQALAGFMAKHTISLYDMIQKDDSPIELWEEKILDHIAYLYLLHYMIQEEYYF